MESVIRSRLHAFGFDKPTIPWTTSASTPSLSDVGHTPNLTKPVGFNATRLAASVRVDADFRALVTMEGLRPRRSDAVRRAGVVDGPEFNPGREATAKELMSSNAVAGPTTASTLATFATATRVCSRRSTSSRSHERGTRAEISHLNVRHNTNV